MLLILVQLDVLYRLLIRVIEVQFYSLIINFVIYCFSYKGHAKVAIKSIANLLQDGNLKEL